MSADEIDRRSRERIVPRMSVDPVDGQPKKTGGSSVIDFPGSGRAPIPAWRKELSERVREVQARKAREGEAELGAESFGPEPLAAMDQGTGLGLVPQPEVNPIVAKALERIENARRTVIVARSRGGTALAVARAIEEPVAYVPPSAPTFPMPVANPVVAPLIAEEPEIAAEVAPSPITEAHQSAIAVKSESAPAAIAPTVSEPVVERSQPAEIFLPAVDEVIISKTVTALAPSIFELDSGVVVDPAPTSVITLHRHDEEILDEESSSLGPRAAAGVLDLMVVIFATSPFAAVIELAGGDWSNWHVWGALAAIGAILMVLYQASAVALAGRTWGMSVLSLRVAEFDFGLYPSFGQSLARALIYLLSLVPAGLGLLYAFVDRDRLTLHDRISGTVVVRSE